MKVVINMKLCEVDKTKLAPMMLHYVELKEKNMDTTKIIGKYMPVLEYLSSFLSIIMILVGGILVINKSMLYCL